MNRKKILDKYHGKCAYCAEEITMESMHVDHIVPKFNGGTNQFSNLNPACRSCNQRKSALSLEEFRSEVGMQIERLRQYNSQFRLAERFGLLQVTGAPVVFLCDKKRLKKRRSREQKQQ